MALQIGAQLGIHEITALLGKGGMGEVYRARDLKLKREVAIKVLPDEFSSDSDRVVRFQREAEVLASLNHPNIAGIYDFQEAGDLRYLVLELVEGETLADRIARGAIPVEEALNIAKGICEALEAAHEKGIVHRDLKPANVKVTPDGKVKVLDFGLAKAISGANSSANAALSNSPTMMNSFPATNAGMIIGTAAYMSPEQARGFVADQRSDIFSFGCVLYEMLGGQRAFDGETVSDILASVLAREPDFAFLPKDLNPRLLEFLRRCLSKNRKKRWHCAGDLRAELETISAVPHATPAHAGQPVSKPRPFWKRAIPILSTAIVFTAITAIAVWDLKPAPPEAVTRFSISIPPDQQLSVVANTLALSPDGSHLAYVAGKRIYLRSMAELDARPIPGTDAQGIAIFDPVFSPDGQSIIFSDIATVTDATIKKMAISGGAPVTIFHGILPIGMQWDATGIVFAEFAGSTHHILRISPNGGAPEVLLTLKNDEFVANAQMLPGGQAVLFTTSNDTNDWEKARVVVQTLKSGERKTLIEGGSAARYVPTGHIVYVLGGTLFAIRFDPRKLEVVGGPTPIVEGVMRASGAASMTHFTFSTNGSLVYIPGPVGTSANRQPIAFIEPSGQVKALDLPPGAYGYPRVSPDGKRIAFGTDTGKEAIVWIYDLSGAASMRRLTFGGSNRYPIWSPDSQRVAFQSDREGDAGIFWQRADGTGTVERLTNAEKETQQIPDSWSPDGRQLSFTAVKPPGVAAVWILSLQDKKTTPFAEAAGTFLGRSVFSPDGKWLAYQSNETKRSEIFVQPFPATGAKYQITRDTDSHHPRWSPDGKELFYIPGPLQFLKVSISTQPAFSVGNPVPAVSGTARFTEGGPAFPRAYDITPDGKRFLGVLTAASQTPAAAQSSPQIQVVLNWFEELKLRVPVR